MRLEITMSEAKARRFKKHLESEHPSTRGHMKIKKGGW
jgi:hypothetical protein